MAAWTLFCDTPSLAVEGGRIARSLGLDVEPKVVDDPACAAAQHEGRSTLAALHAPSESSLFALAKLSSPFPLAVLRDAPRALCADLGNPCVRELRPLLALLPLIEAGAFSPRMRGLEAADRARLEGLATGQSPGELVLADEGAIALLHGEKEQRLGEARDIAAALRAFAACRTGAPPPMPTVEGVDPQAVLDVILGPPRALSDPASKAALGAYDLPTAEEELCSSPSRAASEAGRIGFPVRVVLASPDLRLWDHPDLAADNVDNAARVRDVYRQMTRLAGERLPAARILGVTVSATTQARALLRVDMRSAPDGWVIASLAFADPHGLAAQDRTELLLPCTPDDLETAVRRLRGAELVLAGSAAASRATLHALGDALLRVAAFVHEWRKEVLRVRLDPLALLVGGDVEVREACVQVGDAFVRTLEGLPVT